MLKEISTWSSIRKFDSNPIADEQIISVLEAERRAPSWKNIQPWKFIVVKKEDDKAKLAEAFAMGGLIKKAPAVILCVGQLDAWSKTNQRNQLKTLFSHSGFNLVDEEIYKKYLDTDLAQSLASKPSSLAARTFENMGIAYGFMLLEAKNQGLGACIVGELDNELVTVNNKVYSDVKKYFNLTNEQIITAAIILGVPANQASPNPRKNSEEIYTFF